MNIPSYIPYFLLRPNLKGKSVGGNTHDPQSVLRFRPLSRDVVNNEIVHLYIIRHRSDHSKSTKRRLTQRPVSSPTKHKPR